MSGPPGEILSRAGLGVATLREAPAGAELPSQQLLLRAGMLAPLAGGSLAWLPLGLRALRRLAAVVRRCLEAERALEAALPPMAWSAPRERILPWPGSAAPLALADLAAGQVASYRHLPFNLAASGGGTEPVTVGRGLLRSTHLAGLALLRAGRDRTEAEAALAGWRQGIDRLLVACGLGAEWVRASPAPGAEALVLAHAAGEERVLWCGGCGERALAEVARCRFPPAPTAEPQPLEEVTTPGATTIEQLAAFLGITPAQTAKTGLWVGDGRLLLSVVRGDGNVSERKLAQAAGVATLRPAQPEDLAPAGLVAGYASPVGVKGVMVVVDEVAAASPNLVAGANREGYHLRNVNLGRDYSASLVADIVAARAGLPCARCGAPLREQSAVVLAALGPLATAAGYLDERGARQPLALAGAHVDLGRLLAAVVEAHHDERGIVWPADVAPLEVYLVVLDPADPEVAATAQRLAAQLAGEGLAVLLDDRKESAGVKFADADLIGLPHRLTLSRRTVPQGVVEWKRRSDPAPTLVPLGAVKGMVAPPAPAEESAGG